MGDRCCVTITIRKSDMHHLVRGFFDGDNEKFFDATETNDVWENDDGTITLAAEEVNYASWYELEDILHDHNIEYDKENSPGMEYGAGRAHARIVGDDGLQRIELDDSSIALGDFISDILRLEDPLLICDAIREMYLHIYPFEVKPLVKEGRNERV